MEEEGRKEAAKIARTAEKSDFQNGILSGGAVTAVSSPSSQWAPPSLVRFCLLAWIGRRRCRCRKSDQPGSSHHDPASQPTRHARTRTMYHGTGLRREPRRFRLPQPLPAPIVVDEEE